MELRQLRYFVTVADALNCGRAAQRLRIAGPSLSQQIKALERDLKVQLFDRDRRSVALTAAGSALLPRARALIGQADELRRQALGLSSSEPVRIGCVQWCPTDWTERAAGVAQLRVDTWVMPSHAQSARVAEGSLDLAICWVQHSDLDALSLDARLVGVDRRYAIGVGADSSPVHARDVTVLLNNPKGRNDVTPGDLAHRPVTGPTPMWTWSLVSRRGEDSAPVLAVIEAFTADLDRSALDGRECGCLQAIPIDRSPAELCAADAQPDRHESRGRHHHGRRDERVPEAIPNPFVQKRSHQQRPQDLADRVPAGEHRDGAGARPTTIHAPLPTQPAECCPMAATRNVPAMM